MPGKRTKMDVNVRSCTLVTNGCATDDLQSKCRIRLSVVKKHKMFDETLTWDVSAKSQDDVETQIHSTASLREHTQRRKDDRTQHLTTFSTS